jgi:hypothetical protein
MNPENDQLAESDLGLLGQEGRWNRTTIPLVFRSASA